MPIFNVTIEDISPLLVYKPAGEWDSSPNDPFLQPHANGTFHATQYPNATATLAFHGSAVYVYGAFLNNGLYAVTLDGITTVANRTGNDLETGQSQQLIFSAKNLSMEEHQLQLQNQFNMETPSRIALDFILVTSGDGNPNSQSHVTILDDGDPGISYSGHWASSPNPFSPSYYNDTMHRTRQAGASAEISFQGNSIEIYGATSGNHGAFAVDIDGGPSTVLNGSAAKFFPQNMLYWADGLPTGPHTLTLWNLDSSGKYFDLDKVVVTQWIDSGSGGSGNTNNNHPAVPLPVASGTTYPHSKSKASVGTIVGSAIAGSIALILALLALYFYFRRRLRLHEMLFPGTSISDGRATRHGPDGQTDTPFSHKSKMFGTAFVDSNDMSEPKIVLPNLPPFGYTKGGPVELSSLYSPRQSVSKLPPYSSLQ